MGNITWGIGATMAILLSYIVVLYCITGRNRNAKNLIWAFLAIDTLGIVYHMYLFCAVTNEGFTKMDNGIYRFIFSVQYSLEMFIANTIIFKGEVMTALKHNPLLFNLYLPLYGAAILTSAFTIFHFLPRRLFNWIWLTTHKFEAKRGGAHIFIGINRQALLLAEEIYKKDKKVRIIFVDIPEQQDKLQGLSVWDFISQFFNKKWQSEDLSKYVVLRAPKGLGKLLPWLKCKKNSIYILSDSQEANMKILENVWSYITDSMEKTDQQKKGLKEEMDLEHKIYCHAKKEGLINRYDSIADTEDRIRFIDSSYLAVEFMKKGTCKNLLPVNYVDIAEDPKTKEKLGYVTSPFKCAILGFGETGKEALKFLYEFGAFPKANKKKSTFECHVFDQNIETITGNMNLTEYRDPDATDEEIIPHTCVIGDSQFWNEMRRLIKSLNYIVVCLGNDNLSVKIAMDLLEFAVVSGRDVSDKFLIAIKQMTSSKLNDSTIAKAREAFNTNIEIFGEVEKIWVYDIITNKRIDKEAEYFYNSYTNLATKLNIEKAKQENYSYEAKTWKERNADIISNNYTKRCKTRRQIAQDYSNCLHKNTKLMLCPNLKEYCEEILEINDDRVHSAGKHSKILEYLAICEHLRWNASHIILGYKPTDESTDDLKKVHNCLKPYHSLDEDIKHYDWLVVKNSGLLQTPVSESVSESAEKCCDHTLSQTQEGPHTGQGKDVS